MPEIALGGDCAIGLEAEGAVPAEPVDGRIFFAGKACSGGDFSTAHGAYETGIAAAEAIVGRVP